MKISLVAPAYNEADGIENVVKTWSEYLDKSNLIEDYEIIICNDGSTDSTLSVLLKLQQNVPKLIVIDLPQNYGATVALKFAIQHSNLDYVLLLDSDGQFPISNFELLHDVIDSKAVECVMGIRFKSSNPYHRFGTKVSGLICNYIYGSNLSDFNSAFKLIKGTIAKQLNIEARGLNYSTDITAKLLEQKYKIIEVPIHHCERIFGNSKMKFIRGAYSRFLFIAYLSFRKFLIFSKIIFVEKEINGVRYYG